MTRQDLQDLKHVRVADVYKAGRLAARLRRADGAMTFDYLSDYLRDPGDAVASTLPLTSEPQVRPAGAVPPYFAGLLPEGRRLTSLRGSMKISADDDLSLLLAVGADTVGDVQVVPQGEQPIAPDPVLAVDSWKDVRFADLYERGTGQPLVDRVGLAGVQDKVSARMISLPLTTNEARYILKLNPPELPHLVANEAFFLDAARTSGLRVTRSSVVEDASGTQGLLVERFDRQVDERGVVRGRAQEDGCQALGLYPADKYNVTYEQVGQALTGLTSAQPVAARDYLRQVTFAYLTCNGDAHAKNFSAFQSDSGEWRVSPAYDLPTSHPYGDVTMALSVAGKSKENIGRKDLVQFAIAISVPQRAAERVIDELIDASDEWLPSLSDLPFDQHRTVKLRRSIMYRIQRLRS